MWVHTVHYCEPFHAHAFMRLELTPGNKTEVPTSIFDKLGIYGSSHVFRIHVPLIESSVVPLDIVVSMGTKHSFAGHERSRPSYTDLETKGLGLIDEQE
jgi:hypothetical protein